MLSAISSPPISPSSRTLKSATIKAAITPPTPSLLQYPSSTAHHRSSIRFPKRASSRGIGTRGIAPLRCVSALTPELKSTLDTVVSTHKVVLFMKGTKDFPQCGFSHTVVQILKSLNVPFETINILENDLLRQGMKEYSSWPTFPQLYIDGEFFGGCDIAVEAYQNGQLQEEVEKALCS